MVMNVLANLAQARRGVLQIGQFGKTRGRTLCFAHLGGSRNSRRAARGEQPRTIASASCSNKMLFFSPQLTGLI
jgi:hypothetical protein